MSIDEELLAKFKSLEDEIASMQTYIDRTRAEFPYDNVMQYQLDQAQTALDSRKRIARRAKEQYSRMTQS
jgi:hypothetical protein